MTKLLSTKALCALAIAAALAGCSSSNFENFPMPGAQSVRNTAPHSSTAGISGDELPASERLRVRPLSPEDLDCPSAEIAENGQEARVGGPDNASVRYQFDISKVDRECDPQGGQFALRIGVTGLLLVGPGGKPGAYATDLKIVVVNAADKKPVYQKTYRIDADTKGASQTEFHLLADPILLPLTRTDLDTLFDVTVGFGKTPDTPAKKHEKKNNG